MRHSQKADDAAAAANDLQPEAEHGSPDLSARYAADHAALAFGIPRIAPVPMAADAAEPAKAAGFCLEVEDLTESLTADEREAAEAAAFAALVRADPADPGAAERPDAAVVSEPMSSEPVTAALRMPQSREPGLRPAWGATLRQPLPERQTVHTVARPPRPAGVPLGELGALGPGEAATTTVTLPAVAGPAPLGGEARWTRGAWASPRSAWELGKQALLGAGVVVALGLAVLVGRAWPLADGGPRALPPTPQPVRPADGIGRERLIEQAMIALREGRRDHALVLLRRYQAGQPEPDQAVEIMLRVLRKDRIGGRIEDRVGLPGPAGSAH